MTSFSRPSELCFYCPDKGQTFPSDFRFTKLPELMTEGAVEERHKLVLLCVVLYIKAAPMKEAQGATWYSRKESGRYNYERILYAMDVNAREGSNIVAFILGKKTNVCFFDAVVRIRDGHRLGEFLHSFLTMFSSYSQRLSLLVSPFCSTSGPGGVFAIEMPSNIEQFMTGSDVPILFTTESIYSIDMENKVIPQRSIVEETRASHAFCYTNVIIKLGGVTVMDVDCCGKLCDAYGMYANSEKAGSCGCFKLEKYDAHICGFFELTFQKKQEQGDELSLDVHVKDYTSKKFTKLFIKGGKIPIGLTAPHITRDRRRRNEFRRSVDNVIRTINEGGSSKDPEKRGFMVQGWVRRGQIRDQGVEASGMGSNGSGRQAQLPMVDASTFVYHITSIVPTSHEVAAEVRSDDGLLFDASSLLDGSSSPPSLVGSSAPTGAEV